MKKDKSGKHNSVRKNCKRSILILHDEKNCEYLLGNVVFKLEMVDWNFIALNMVFKQMDKYHQIRQLVLKMMHSTHFPRKLEQKSMFQEQFLLILIQHFLMKFEFEYIDNFFIQNKLLMKKSSEFRPFDGLRLFLTALEDTINKIDF
jgi:hypothetical protein